MPTDRALALLDEMRRAGVSGLQLTGGGEPLLNPAHHQIMRRALELGFKCSLVSNGLAMTPELIGTLADFAWVRISVDAGNEETYSRTRTTHPKNFHKVIGNIASLAAAIRERDTDCILGMGFVVMPHNWRELEAGVLIAKEAGCENIRLSAMFSPEDEKPYITIYDDIKAAIAAVKRHETDEFKVHDLFGERLEDLRLHNPDYPVCAKMHYCSYIGADLQVYMCCVYSYNERGKVAGDFGNLRHRAFDEFWASDERKKFMEDFTPSECVRCQFNPANREMNKLLGPPPIHVEFP
jgi:MoaA/NifB/PqqE/SkfB family radical SAM enzyme